MTEQLKQSISALLDDEISEIEVHRLVREFGQDAELKRTWIRYAQVRAVSQGHHHLDEGQHLALHERISAAIGEEDHHDLKVNSAATGWQRQAAGFAVAASLVAAVLVGVNLNEPSNLTGPAMVDTRGTNPIDVQTVSTQPTARNESYTSALVDSSAADTFSPSANDNEVAFSEDELELRELDEVKQQQLREYLMRHDRMSRINNNTQTVNYSGKNYSAKD